MRRAWLLLALLVCAAVGTPLPRADGADRIPLAVIAHPSVKSGAVHVNELRAIFLRQSEQLDGQRVVPLSYAPSSPLRIDFDERVLGMTPEEVGRYWVDARIRGLGTSPRAVASPQLLIRTVALLPGAISYAPKSMLAGMPVKILQVEGLTQPL